MGLDLWDRGDIENTLLSLHQATLQSGVDGDYRRGFEAALVSVALAFGLDPGRDLAPRLQAPRGGLDNARQ